MCGEIVNWREWSAFFQDRANRPLPRAERDELYLRLPASLSRSLAIFQLGESGGGTIIEQARHSDLGGIDEHFVNAMRLFVREENRHADILARCVEMLGGRLIRKNWTARLFVASRRLLGLRMKVMVLLAAELVGLCYYHLLASAMPPCQIRTLLSELVSDERAHLRFHCCFLNAQTRSTWRRVIFVMAWRTTIVVAAAAVLLDHRPAIRDLGIDAGVIWRRWVLYGRLAERLVKGTDLSDGSADLQPFLMCEADSVGHHGQYEP